MGDVHGFHSRRGQVLESVHRGARLCGRVDAVGEHTEVGRIRVDERVGTVLHDVFDLFHNLSIRRGDAARGANRTVREFRHLQEDGGRVDDVSVFASRRHTGVSRQSQVEEQRKEFIHRVRVDAVVVHGARRRR